MSRIGLLRGVNVGRNRRISMAELRSTLARAGYDEVRTHGQSGNVVFASRKKPATLERELLALLGVQVVVRTAEELAAVVAHDPLRKVADNGSRYLVTFLSRPLAAQAVRSLKAATALPEQLAVHGREVYSWHPGGLYDSPLAKALAAPQDVVATGRNWNTVTKLLALAQG
jgi:uncharacterized protein (DUF1697 family)